MSKVELQAKVDALDGEIKFFKCLYEGVRLPHTHPSSVFWKDRCEWAVTYSSATLRAQEISNIWMLGVFVDQR